MPSTLLCSTSRMTPKVNTASQGHLNSFLCSVNELRGSKGGKAQNDLIEKQLQVLSKISDLTLFEVHLEFFLDLRWLMSNSDPKSSLLWSCISLLTKIITKSKKCRIFVRDSVRMLSDLTDLLLKLPATSHERGLKVMDLMRYLTLGIKIGRLEEFLIQLLPKLFELSEGKDEVAKSHSLFLLNGLCHQNYVVKKYLLSIMKEANKKIFFAQDCEEPRIKVLVTMLNIGLNKTNLNFRPESVGFHLDSVCEALCTAYGDENFLLMDMLILHLQQNFTCHESEEDARFKALLSAVQQVVLLLDFAGSSGDNQQSNECIFKFFRVALNLSNEPRSLIDIILKTLLSYMESTSMSLESETESVMLLADIVEKIGQNTSLTEVELQDLRYQLEGIVGKFCNQLIQKQKVSEVILETLTLICQIQNWHELITTKVKPGSLADIAKSNRLTANEVSSLILLMSEISKLDVNWKNSLDEVLTKHDIQSLLVQHFKEVSSNPKQQEKILKVLQKFNCTQKTSVDVEEILENNDLDFEVDNDSALNQMLDKVTKKLANQDLSVEVSEMVDLYSYGQQNFQRTTSELRSSLKLADERIANQNRTIQALELELVKQRKVMKIAFESSTNAKSETEEIWQQYNCLQEEALKNKKIMKQECQEKDTLIEKLESEIMKMEKENEKIANKAVKYKEQNECLQETIKEHLKTQEELQTKLKAEVKSNTDMTTLLEKREEKLKKKELQIDEMASARDRLQAELESVRKECSSLQTLTKRQEQALAKKEKQLHDQTEDLEKYKQIQEQIFNLSKLSK